MFHYDGTPGSVTTYTYFVEDPPAASTSSTTRTGVNVVTKPDGTTERFRDKPVRHLVVEPEPDTGEMRPAIKGGLPYTCTCAVKSERCNAARASPTGNRGPDEPPFAPEPTFVEGEPSCVFAFMCLTQLHAGTMTRRS